jgi:hypothetical protein
LNARDLEEMTEKMKAGLRFELIEHADQALAHALEDGSEAPGEAAPPSTAGAASAARQAKAARSPGAGRNVAGPRPGYGVRTAHLPLPGVA